MSYDAIEDVIGTIKIAEIKPLATDIGEEIRAAIKSKRRSIKVSQACSFLSSFFIPIGALVTCISALWTLVSSGGETPPIFSSIIAGVSFFIGIFSVLNTKFEFRKRLYHTQRIYIGIIQCKSDFLTIIASHMYKDISLVMGELAYLQQGFHKVLEQEYPKEPAEND